MVAHVRLELSVPPPILQWPMESRRLHMVDRWLGRFRKGKGRVLRSAGSYRFAQLLGKGGMGEVWLAEKIGSDEFSKLVAIKTIAAHRLEDLRILKMFLDEARLVANLVHPNIVQVYQLARTRKEVFIIMEHVFGRTVLQLLERLARLNRQLPVDIAVYLVARICHGLYYAHNKHDRRGAHLKIVHRDICPSNILISFRGIPKLTDFGVAKAITSSVDDEGNVVWGKYPYMAPEAVSRTGTDPRSDIYSLGLVLYEMLSGQVAHNVGDTQALTRLLEDESRSSRDVRAAAPHVPDSLADIILRATDPDPDRRPQTAKALASELEQFLLSRFLFPDEEGVADFLASAFTQASRHRWW